MHKCTPGGHLNNAEGGYWFTVCQVCWRVMDRWTTIIPFEIYECRDCHLTVHVMPRHRQRSDVSTCRRCQSQMPLRDWYPRWPNIIDEAREQTIIALARQNPRPPAEGIGFVRRKPPYRPRDTDTDTEEP